MKTTLPVPSSEPLKLDLTFFSVEKRKKVKAIMKIYRDIDKKTENFRQKTGLKCLSGCGECCHDKFVSATTLEMLPLASATKQKGELDAWITQVDPKDKHSPCMFFKGEKNSSQGYCQVYEHRPLVCRLFGFSAREDKYKKYELMVCRKIKEAMPEVMEKAEAQVDAGKRHAPLSQEYVMKTFTLSLQDGGDSRNINHAFAKAAEIVQLQGRLFASSTTS